MSINPLNIVKSVNGIPLWIMAPSDGKAYVLTQNVNLMVAVPSNATTVLLSYSAGATVLSTIAESGYSNALPTNSTGVSTTGAYNRNGWPVKQFDPAGNQQYVHMISPNAGDQVCITWNYGAV